MACMKQVIQSFRINFVLYSVIMCILWYSISVIFSLGCGMLFLSSLSSSLLGAKCFVESNWCSLTSVKISLYLLLARADNSIPATLCKCIELFSWNTPGILCKVLPSWFNSWNLCLFFFMFFLNLDAYCLHCKDWSWLWNFSSLSFFVRLHRIILKKSSFSYRSYYNFSSNLMLLNWMVPICSSFTKKLRSKLCSINVPRHL